MESENPFHVSPTKQHSEHNILESNADDGLVIGDTSEENEEIVSGALEEHSVLQTAVTLAEQQENAEGTSEPPTPPRRTTSSSLSKLAAFTHDSGCENVEKKTAVGESALVETSIDNNVEGCKGNRPNAHVENTGTNDHATNPSNVGQDSVHDQTHFSCSPPTESQQLLQQKSPNEPDHNFTVLSTPPQKPKPMRIWSSPFQAPQLNLQNSTPNTDLSEPRQLWTTDSQDSSSSDEGQPHNEHGNLLFSDTGINDSEYGAEEVYGQRGAANDKPRILSADDILNADEPDEYFGDHQGFWAQIQNWKEKVLSKEMKVRISSPKQGQRSLLRPSPPVTYLIETHPMGCSVRRRYSDFEWLHDSFQAKYFGLLIPPIPEKRAVGNTGEEFVRQRMRALDSFLRRVLANPFLRADATFHEFLSVVDPMHWERLRKSKPALSQNNEAEVQWRKCLHRFKVPEDGEVILHSMKNQLRSLQEMLSTVVHSASSLVVAAHHHCEAQIAFKQDYLLAFGAYQAAQRSWGAHPQLGHHSAQQISAGRYAQPGSAPCPKAEGSDSISDLFRQLGYHFAAWSDVASYDHHVLRQVFVEVLQYETFCVRDLKRLIKRRDKQIEGHNAACAKLRKAEIKYRNYVNSHRPLQTAMQEGAGGKLSASATADPVQVASLKAKVDQAQGRVRKAASIVQQTTKGLFYSQVEGFADQRVDSLKQMTGVVAAAYLKHVQQLARVWQNCIDSLGLNWQEMASLAKPMLQAVDEEKRAYYMKGKVAQEETGAVNTPAGGQEQTRFSPTSTSQD